MTSDEAPDLRIVPPDDSAATATQDGRLIRGLLLGDASALTGIIDRYDKLVRYTVFNTCRTECRRDPTFLDARASDVWAGFVDSIRKRNKGPDGALPAYLVRIARNKCTDFLRKADRSPTASTLGDDIPADSTESDPIDALIRFEQAEHLRACIASLDLNDRNLLKEIELITQKRWSEAAQRLNLAESTLRSRWARILDRLRDRLEKN